MNPYLYLARLTDVMAIVAAIDVVLFSLVHVLWIVIFCGLGTIFLLVAGRQFRRWAKDLDG